MVTIAAWILIAAGACFIGLNYGALVVNHRNRRHGVDRHSSFIPLMGGLLCALGAWLLARSGLALLVALLDPGVWVFLLLPVALLRRTAPDGGKR